MSLPAEEHHLHTRAFKHMWARHVAQKGFEDDVQAAAKRVIQAQQEHPELFPKKVHEDEGVSKILDKTQKLTGVGFVPRKSNHLEIGIIGAGVAGLFTAMVFDWLNEQCQKEGLKIEYDIIEAAKMNRLGGRLYTHRFSRGEHDYYDVGAMRFPNNTIMKSLLQVKPSDLVSEALEDFIKVAAEKFKKAVEENDEKGPETTKLWALLMEADKLSTRQFLSSGDGDRKKREGKPKDNSGLIPEGPGYNYNTIEWLESATYGTGWYDQSLTECVLEELDFATPKSIDGQPTNYWWCIDGGAQTIAHRMARMIKQPVQYNSQVVAIDAQVEERKKRKPKDFTSMKLRINKNQVVKEKEYFAVFNSTTLGALQRMDLKDAGLLWGTRQAIRALGYGASCKVGIKFETAWWQKPPFNIKKGGIAHTDLPLRVCVYPSYNIESNEGQDWDPNKPAVLLCSYTWGQDEQRIGSLISPQTPKNEEQLLSVLLHDLALLHSKQSDYTDENMSGAFAYFGPSQFSNMWSEIIKPNAYGQLYLIGEASSSHHAWIVGALESVIRAVYLMFEGLQKQDPDNAAYKKAIELLSKEPDTPKEGGDVFGGFPGDKPQEPQKLPSGLPFHPLPEEMPKRQLDADRDAKLVRDPLEDVKFGDKVSLLFSSAMITLSLIESFFELQVDEAKDKPQ
ncbi:related to L-amino-acid oxidase [Fusarium fujikuroi]|nr:related to L-amino-acid oxidase [Fusarium fujikuroi]